MRVMRRSFKVFYCMAGAMLAAVPAQAFDYDKAVAAKKLSILNKASAGKTSTSLAISDPGVALWGGGGARPDC